ncbi:uncharacterized protein LOC6641917 [Drosophila willistoni]|uniref:uncharacterized protein LOC6641917 n=1 Tax=Drosophila willistoni TaxID=7260 RepID=UPI001F07926D|nr:uncharacterized protein LOC6641917 [Drosophila willistoni]
MQTFLKMRTDNFLLISQVAKRQALWNTSITLADRKDSWISQWQEVASIMQLDVLTCKKRFKRLRDTYRAEIRKIQQRGSGTSNWPYFRAMEFLRCIFDPEGMVTFLPEAFDYEQAAYRNQAELDNSKMDDFVIEVDDDDDFDFEIMGDIFKQGGGGGGNESRGSAGIGGVVAGRCSVSGGGGGGDSSSAGQDSGSEFSVRKTINVNTNVSTTSANHLEADTDISPQLLSPMPLPPNHMLLPRPAKRGRPRKTSSPCETNVPSSTPTSIAAASDSTTAPGVSKDDADYNFLVSLLPHVKSLSDIGNLKFRMEISRILLDIKHDEQTAPSPEVQQLAKQRSSLPKLISAPVQSTTGPVPVSTSQKKRSRQQAMQEEPASKYAISSSGYVDSSMIECDVKIENETLF